MTVPPLPASPVVRIRCIWNQAASGEGGTRFFMGYSGSAPSSTNLDALADEVITQWNTQLIAQIPTDVTLTEVVCEDITTYDGATGSAGPGEAGTRDGTPLPYQCAFQVNYAISRRYRGGRPKGYWPFGITADLLDPAHFVVDTAGGWANDVAGFMTAIGAYSSGLFAVTGQVNLSLYNGFTVVTPPDGRSRTVPKYRDTGVVDAITAWNGVSRLASQRRRRTATSP